MIRDNRNILTSELYSGAIFFYHIPKTAGTTLHELFKRIYGKNNTITLNTERLETYTDLTDQQKKKLRVVGGHMPFGYHLTHPVPGSYFTFFRDPLKRAISGYKHILTHPSRQLHVKYIEESVTLEQHLLDPRFDDFQVKRVLFDVETPFPDVVLNDGTFEFALERLENSFAFAGLLEYYDESLLILKKLYNWPDPFYSRKNVSPLSNVPLLCAKEVEEEFIHRNKYDYMLFNQVKTSMENLIKTLGPEFQQEVQTFKVNNK